MTEENTGKNATNNFRDKIIKFKANNRLTYDQLNEMCGLDNRAIQHFLTNGADLPLSLAVQISEGLKIPLT